MLKRRCKAPIEEYVYYSAEEGEDPKEYQEMREDEERATLRWCLRDHPRGEATLAEGEVRDV